MKYQILISLILLCLPNIAKSESLVDRSADSDLMVRQIPNSESAVKHFFSKLPVDSDTIYATIFRPANCPRCDGFINKIYSLIKKETGKPSILIAVYPDTLAVQSYLDKYDIKSDYLMFDTTEDFSKFLSFSCGYLHVGYILKINKKTGELIVGSNADNVRSAFFKELNAYTSRKPPMEFPGAHGDYYNWDKTDSGLLSVSYSYPLVIPDDSYRISEVIYQPVFHKDRLLWNDKLALAVAEFELNDSSLYLKRIVEPDSIECSQFVRIPPSYYERMLKSNELKNIPLQPFIIDEDKYGVAYSLSTN